MFTYKSKYRKVGVLAIWKVNSNVSSVDTSSENQKGILFSDERPTLETLDFTIDIGSTPTTFLICFVFPFSWVFFIEVLVCTVGGFGVCYASFLLKHIKHKNKNKEI